MNMNLCRNSPSGTSFEEDQAHQDLLNNMHRMTPRTEGRGYFFDENFMFLQQLGHISNSALAFAERFSIKGD